MLTSTGDVIGWWKEYFEDLLHPIDTFSSEEAESGDTGIGLSITEAKVPKVYAGVLEKKVQLIVEPRIQEEQCEFRRGRGTLDQLFTLSRILEGSWEFAQPVHMCFVDLEKAFDCVPWGILRSQGMEGVRFGDLRVTSLLSADDVVLLGTSGHEPQLSLDQFAAECEAAGMRISTSKSEAMGRGGMLEPIPAVIGRKAGYTLDRKPENLEETHADTGRTCKLHTERTLAARPENRTLALLTVRRQRYPPRHRAPLTEGKGSRRLILVMTKPKEQKRHPTDETIAP
ncbi:hypothetical protein SRHO_G00059260 [Serrasalmus rhombeus]